MNSPPSKILCEELDGDVVLLRDFIRISIFQQRNALFKLHF